VTHEIWESAALVLGFQAAGYAWRMAEESRVSRTGDVTWLPVADMLNLASIAVSIVGVYVLPTTGYRVLIATDSWFALSLLLFLGHLISVAAHYELFDIRHPRSMRYFPRQERIAVAATLVSALVYLTLLLFGTGE
jgi:hypothetical protein